MAKKQKMGFESLPPASTCRLIPFSRVNVLPGDIKGSYILVVKGEMPNMNMDVKLVPVTYVKQPDYWQIEVVGCLSGAGLDAIAPYKVTLPLSGPMGKKGIVVVGAGKEKKINLPIKQNLVKSPTSGKKSAKKAVKKKPKK
ncbi:MAG: hypothetical protein AAF570_02350 [Bacteroidota bacterium]